MNFSKAERRRRAHRANHARKFINRDTQREAVRKVGLVNAASGHLAAIRTLDICSAGGKAALQIAIANNPDHQSEAGKLGGKIGGKIQGAENARIGWMRHIALKRYGKSHHNCAYCRHHLKFKPQSAARKKR